MKMRLLSVILLHGVCVLLLSALTVSAVSLSVTPDHKQFFSSGALVILTCDDDDEQRVDGWTVKRTRAGVTERCGAAAGLVLKNSLCQLILHKPSDGAYFCESSSGQRSDEVNIIVSAGSLILDIPSSPVWTGSNVTLLCQTRDGKPGKSYFYKDGNMIGSDLEGKWTFTNVQKSDEGLYSCSTGVDQSPKSRLTVRDPPPSVKASTTTTRKPAIRPRRPRPRRPRPRRPHRPRPPSRPTPPTRHPPHRPSRHRPPRPPPRHRPPRPRPRSRPPPPTRPPPPRPPPHRHHPPPPTRPPPPPRPPHRHRPPPPTRPPPPRRPRPRVIRSHSFGPPLTASIM